MKIISITPLAGDLVEVLFEDGLRAQFDKNKLSELSEDKPEHYAGQVREILAADTGVATEASAQEVNP